VHKIRNSKSEQTLGRLEEALADMQPFTVTLQSFELFRNKKSATLWLSPETSPDRMALDKLQLALQAYEKKNTCKKKIGFADICVSYFSLYVCVCVCVCVLSVCVSSD
jgi:2'-5' RNA ligase